MKELDEFDIAILRMIQKDVNVSASSIADEVDLSPSAVSRRLTRLRKTGVIESEIAILSPKAVGRRMTIIVEVELERERPDLLSEFKQRIHETPEVTQCYYVTGSADFVLIVMVRDIEDYEAFSRGFFTENANIRRFHTNVVLDRVKMGLQVPLSSPE